MMKHFWLRDKIKGTKGYCVNSYGALNILDLKVYETIWLNYQEIEKILNLKTKEEKYYECNKLFNEKFPQLEEYKKELSKEEQSKLEKLFP